MKPESLCIVIPGDPIVDIVRKQAIIQAIIDSCPAAESTEEWLAQYRLASARVEAGDVLLGWDVENLTRQSMQRLAEFGEAAVRAMGSDPSKSLSFAHETLGHITLLPVPDVSSE